MKANVAKASQAGTVIHASAYGSGHVTSDGSLVNLGWKLGDVYEYTTQGGSEYRHQVMYQEDGSPYLAMNDHFSPVANGTADDAQTIINPRNDTYSQTQYPGIPDPRAGAATPNLYSSPSEVQQALQSGKVTEQSTATVNGTQATTSPRPRTTRSPPGTRRSTRRTFASTLRHRGARLACAAEYLTQRSGE